MISFLKFFLDRNMNIDAILKGYRCLVVQYVRMCGQACTW